jgi:uncharacterized protein
MTEHPPVPHSAAEFILKVAERCNLNCSYCYYFNGADLGYRHRPAIMPDEVFGAVVRYFRQGVDVLGLRYLQVDFHGGEPLLVGKRRFAAMCRTLRRELARAVDLRIAVQTNAALVDTEWTELFSDNEVHVGGSLDGPRAVHDRARVDHAGRGSYDAVVRGLGLLTDAFRHRRLPGLGVLSVIDVDAAPTAIYQHLAHDLGQTNLDFLLPNATWDDPDPPGQDALAHWLTTVFDCWLDGDYQDVRIRILDSITSVLLGGPSRLFGIGFDRTPPNLLGTINSNGFIAPDDTLRSCGEKIMQLGLTVGGSTMAELARSPRLRDLERSRVSVHEQCRRCCWLEVCGGGHLVNRFSRSRGFDNPCLYCDALKRVYGHVSSRLIRLGLNVEDLMQNLGMQRNDSAAGSGADA